MNDNEIIISIHPLRGEWDLAPAVEMPPAFSFQSTHSVGSGTRLIINIPPRHIFQSTHSVGSGTQPYSCSMSDRHFNPPTPWGVGQLGSARLGRCMHFNPPTPWGVGRHDDEFVLGGIDFNPPTPWGVGLARISSALVLVNFNPPTPWGVGRPKWTRIKSLKEFQSTHSVGSGTDCRRSRRSRR